MENKVKCHKCGESMSIYVTPGKIEVNIYCNVCDIRLAVFNTKRKKAPELDYKGNALYEGDTIIHPNGQRGEIKYYRFASFSNKWRVFYNDDKSDHSALFLQVGHRGQAVWKREKRRSIRVGGGPDKSKPGRAYQRPLSAKGLWMNGPKPAELSEDFGKYEKIIFAVNNPEEEETAPCDICGKPTPMTGTKLCDLCYSVQQIFDKPDLVIRAIEKGFFPADKMQELFSAVKNKVEL